MAAVDLGAGVAIAGAGIGGLVAALSLDAIGVEVTVFEAADEVRSAGVGINLLPHSTRELDALGLLDRLATSALAPAALGYFAKNGKEIWSEPRGIEAGYRWPQLSIHRGELHRILLDTATARLGADRVILGHRLTAVEAVVGAASATFGGPGGTEVNVSAAAIIAADGIHSAARAQFYPDQGPPKWSGALLWRGIVDREPVLDGRSMIWIGHPAQKFVGYPIADLDDGRQSFNFIAELRPDDASLADREDWNREGDLADFLPAFEPWVFDWLDVPALIRAARVLAGCIRSHADVETALRRYEQVRLPPTSAIVEANRGLGPERPMQLVEERARGFDHIDDVVTRSEIDEITEGYRRTAGFALAPLDDPTSLADRTY